MQEQIKFAAAILFLLIFLPFLGTIILSGKQEVKLTKEKEIESLLASIVYREIPGQSQDQMICAQAVLVRSRIWLQINKAGDQQAVYDRILKENLDYERDHDMKAEKLSKCREAVRNTKGCVLQYGGQLVEGPFCRASNGWTRGGKEVFGKDSYGWLVGVESKADLDYGVDQKPVSYTEETLYKKMQQSLEAGMIGNGQEAAGGQKLEKEGILDQISVVATDSSGYVTDIQVGGIRMSGEAFRQALELPSASFTYTREGDTIVFICRGAGHGMGLSQFGADSMAREGKGWREILNYYFPNAQVAAITNL